MLVRRCLAAVVLSIPLLHVGSHAAAQAADASAARVTVATTRDPVDKSYRKMIAGMDRFERQHSSCCGACTQSLPVKG